MQEILEYILKNLVNHPEDLKITVETSGVSDISEAETPESISQSYSNQYYKPKVTYVVNANQEDIPLIIGKGGRTIKSIKNIMKIKAIKTNEYFDIQVIS